MSHPGHTTFPGCCATSWEQAGFATRSLFDMALIVFSPFWVLFWVATAAAGVFNLVTGNNEVNFLVTIAATAFAALMVRVAWKGGLAALADERAYRRYRRSRG